MRRTVEKDLEDEAVSGNCSIQIVPPGKYSSVKMGMMKSRFPLVREEKMIQSWLEFAPLGGSPLPLVREEKIGYLTAYMPSTHL